METIQEEEDRSIELSTRDITCSTCRNATTSSCQHDTTSYLGTSFATEGVSIDERDVPKLASYRQLFRYADRWDLLMMAGGLLMSVGRGLAFPLTTVVFHDIFAIFEDYVVRSKPFSEKPTLYAAGFPHVVYLGVISIVTLIVTFIESACWEVVAERQAKRMRINYYDALLKLSVPEYDRLQYQELITRMSVEVLRAREGMGVVAVPCIVAATATFVSGIIIAFVREWRLAAIMLSIVPVLLAVMVAMVLVVNRYAQRVAMAYMPADLIAARVLRSIRTITSLGTADVETNRYSTPLARVESLAYRRVTTRAFASAVVYFLLYGSYSAAFWYSGTLILRDEMTVGKLVNVFFAIVVGKSVLAIGEIPPALQRIAAARQAGLRVFDIIEYAKRVPKDTGTIVTSVRGRIAFRAVDFRYPAVPNKPIIKGFSLLIESGEKVAIVGTDGSGKSTLAQLLLRFYVAQFGAILVDDVDISRLNARSLRQHIGYVTQNPVIFTMTVLENVRMGARDPDVPPTREQVEDACRLAHAHEFIMELEDGYDAVVGDGGIHLTVSQQQRIAIARAIVKNPRILVMDEPTRLLKMNEEDIVQRAMDNAAEGRTTLIVSHWPSAAKNANRIGV
ncbi:P-loop containing nucleoside triphosphate hydrolase protein [Thamnocephalis sphaerospora]|uniref:P-loop containing nucleoside triphosphate hydrolase protein n=1 Tax=Thamnocephalis sphaerospora TaxID=78915 RepID=A0A4P9XJ88_9FUNG|nr:P-loop containing nucleoside triphosphate hydrolase protein [Thamnocephalis sphaerospora]|eukprot:RKP05805.1 P-loop containing nucleoside triphosphate hydrolase protein [Thamnocephalis sphaerospora]